MDQGMEVVDLGLCEYPRAYEIQKQTVFEKRRNPFFPDRLYLVEHPRVFTFGRKSKELATRPSPSFVIERGGEATFHNPGQLVAYPVLSLKEGERDIGFYLRTLEQVVIDTILHWGVLGERKEGATGVWVQGQTKKIASIGVALKGWVTLHGIALNIDNDLSGFYEIHPCGFTGAVMTSLKEQMGESCPSFKEVKAVFVEEFQKHFQRKRLT
ncbi:lipoyl(octanoyl) transferase LipB [bacterium]|nr:lipoyl(octanoyl) transferase LipB [bacterium]